jgi:hypothetical protein
MKYRVIDSMTGRGGSRIKSQYLTDSELDIKEFSKSILLSKIQSQYNGYLEEGDEEYPFLCRSTEFLATTEVRSTLWIVVYGEEECFFVLSEDDRDFNLDEKSIADKVWDDDTWWDKVPSCDFVSLTGFDPYVSGVWTEKFDPGKALLDAGVIKK